MTTMMIPTITNTPFIYNPPPPAISRQAMAQQTPSAAAHKPLFPHRLFGENGHDYLLMLILNVKRKKLQKRSEKGTKHPIPTTRGNLRSKGRYPERRGKRKKKKKSKDC